ncbi:hypothetical protein B0J14DRAFT_123834 [Halenospora varia]|nr:hypothetical protein B0J14DRAFT_123834 [Halenospora varia]
MSSSKVSRKKHHQHSKSQKPAGSEPEWSESEWSDWVWDTTRMRYYQARKDSNDAWEYRYEQATQHRSEQVPRTVDTATPFGSSPGSQSSDSSRHSADYGFPAPQYPQQSGQDDMSAVTTMMSTAAISGSNTTNASSNTYGSPYGSSVSTLNSTDYPSTQPGQMARTGSYYYPPVSQATGYGNSPNSYPLVSQATGYGGSSNSYPLVNQATGYGNSPNSSTMYLAPDFHRGPSSTIPNTAYNQDHDSCSSTPRAGNWFPDISNTGRLPQSIGASIPSSINSQPLSTGQASGSAMRIPEGKRIKGTPGNEEALDDRFKVHYSSYFKPYEVFKILWSEPAGETRTNDTRVTETIHSTLGGRVYTTIRRFIVVATEVGHSQCVPILTYEGRGIKKPGAKKDAHAAVYIGTTRPQVASTGSEPIRIQPISPREKLVPTSLINYAKIYTVEHNVKVFFIGSIHEESRHTFRGEVDYAWSRKMGMQQE